MPGRQFNSGNYKYGFNGKEMDNEIKGSGNSYDFGARMYDSRLGRWMSVDPLYKKFSSLSVYVFVGNNPLNYLDPNGKDIIALNDPKAARSAGHQAVLISDGQGGWNYVSKDAFAGAVPYGAKPVVTVKNFKSLDEFAQSPENMVQDHNGSYLLDEHGKKQQRYTRGYLIKTDPKTDPKSFAKAKEEANKNYNLGLNDCSHVLSEALEAAKTPEGKSVSSGETHPTVIIPATKYTPAIKSPDFNYYPNEKQYAIEARNKGIRIDDKLAIPEKKK
jgi:RHS repeat-associated protein